MLLKQPWSAADSVSCTLQEELREGMTANVNVRVWGGTMTVTTSDHAGVIETVRASQHVQKPWPQENVSVWAADMFHMAANTLISNVCYKKLEQCLFVTMADLDIVNGVYFQVGICWLSSDTDDSAAPPFFKHMTADIFLCCGRGNFPGALRSNVAWQFHSRDPRAICFASEKEQQESLIYFKGRVPRLSPPTGRTVGRWEAKESTYGDGPMVFQQYEAMDLPEAGIREIEGMYVEVDLHWFGPEGISRVVTSLFKHLTYDAWIGFGTPFEGAPRWFIRIGDPREVVPWSLQPAQRGLCYVHASEDGDPEHVPMDGWVECGEGQVVPVPRLRQQKKPAGGVRRKLWKDFGMCASIVAY